MQVGQLMVKLGVDTTQFSRGLADAHKQMEAVDANNKKIEKGAEAYQKVGGAITGVGVIIAGGLGLAAKGAMDFEKQLSSVKAVTGATGPEIEKLHDLAIKMGADTKFSALEAGKGMEELLKAGVSTADVLGGGLKGALDLATAGDLELADAAEIAATALNAFRADNLSVAAAGDILAGAANASATSVGELKYGLSMVSAVASGVGLSFKDTNTALAVMAQNGLKGSDAGTSLKTMLMNLQPSTDKAAQLFEQYGLQTLNASKAMEFLASKGIKPASSSITDIQKSIGDYIEKTTGAKAGSEKFEKAYKALNGELSSNAFYDANGNLKSMGEIAGILNDKFKDLTPQQRSFALEQLFGADATRAANILYKEGAEGIADMDKAMSKVTMEQVAKDKMDNLAGSIEQFQGSLETLGIIIGEKIVPVVRPLVDGFTKFVNIFTELPGPVQTAGVAVIALAGGLALIGGPALMLIGFLPSISAGLAMVAGVFGGASAAGTIFGGVMAFITSPITLTIAAIAALALAGYLIYKNWDKIGPFVKKTWEGVKKFTVKAWDGIKQFLSDWWPALLGPFTMGGSLIAGYIFKHWDGIKAKGVQIWDGIKGFFVRWWPELLGAITGPIGMVAVAIYRNWDGIKTKAGEIWGGIKGVVSGVWTWASTNASSTWDGVKTTISTSWNSLKGNASSAWGGIRSSVSGVWTWYKDTMTGGLNTATGAIGTKFNALKSTASTAWNGIKSVVAGAWSGIASAAKSGANGVIRAMNGMISGLNRIKFTIPGWVPGIGGNSFGINIGHIPYLAAGGAVRVPGSVMVGERGPEILHLPSGAVVEPLNRAGGAIHNHYYAGMLDGAIIDSTERVEEIAYKLQDLQDSQFRAHGGGRSL